MTLRLGSKSETVRAVQEMLNTVGIRTSTADGSGFTRLEEDGEFGARTERAVMQFQAEHGLLVDGKVGPLTLQALEQELRANLVAFSSPGADSLELAPDRLSFERAPADKVGDGYAAVWLRADCAERYRAVYEVANSKGARLTSSGGKRDLFANVGTGRSATSFHYTGRALDLYLYSGMVNPEKDAYVVVLDTARLFRVYARCTPRHAELDHLDRVVTYKNRSAKLSADGAFLDLTALFDLHGFKRISARPDFFDNGSQLGAEWWHFQDETGLEKGKSTFGNELLRVYSRQTLEKSPPWKFRDRVFGVNWS
jgi:hypothetical protein